MPLGLADTHRKISLDQSTAGFGMHARITTPAETPVATIAGESKS
jgi:hypothetical protein